MVCELEHVVSLFCRQNGCYFVAYFGLCKMRLKMPYFIHMVKCVQNVVTKIVTFLGAILRYICIVREVTENATH